MRNILAVLALIKCSIWLLCSAGLSSASVCSQNDNPLTKKSSIKKPKQIIYITLVSALHNHPCYLYIAKYKVLNVDKIKHGEFLTGKNLILSINCLMCLLEHLSCESCGKIFKNDDLLGTSHDVMDLDDSEYWEENHFSHLECLDSWNIEICAGCGDRNPNVKFTEVLLHSAKQYAKNNNKPFFLAPIPKSIPNLLLALGNKYQEAIDNPQDAVLMNEFFNHIYSQNISNQQLKEILLGLMQRFADSPQKLSILFAQMLNNYPALLLGSLQCIEETNAMNSNDKFNIMKNFPSPTAVFNSDHFTETIKSKYYKAYSTLCQQDHQINFFQEISNELLQFLKSKNFFDTSDGYLSDTAKNLVLFLAETNDGISILLNSNAINWNALNFGNVLSMITHLTSTSNEKAQLFVSLMTKVLVKSNIMLLICQYFGSLISEQQAYYLLNEMPIEEIAKSLKAFLMSKSNSKLPIFILKNVSSSEILFKLLIIDAKTQNWPEEIQKSLVKLIFQLQNNQIYMFYKQCFQQEATILTFQMSLMNAQLNQLIFLNFSFPANTHLQIYRSIVNSFVKLPMPNNILYEGIINHLTAKNSNGNLSRIFDPSSPLHDLEATLFKFLDQQKVDEILKIKQKVESASSNMEIEKTS